MSSPGQNLNQNPTSQSKTETQGNTTSKKGIAAFIGSMIVSTVIIIAFFTLGSIFVSKAEFYSKYKMNGRFDDGPPYTTLFPYKNLFTETTDNSWVYRYGRWATETVIAAFAQNRYIVDKIFDYSGKALNEAPGFVTTLVIILGPLIMTGMVFASYFAGIISTVIGAISNLGDVVPNFFEFVVLALPLCIPLLIYPFFILSSIGALSVGVGAVQTAMMIGFLLIMPLLDGVVRQGIINTLIKNKYILFLCIFSVMTMNAFAMLGKTQGYVSLGIAIAALVTYIFMKVL